MWPNFLQNTTLPAVEQTILFAERRHGFVAGTLRTLGLRVTKRVIFQ